MKWGIRRYQNKDGTLTAAGKKHLEEKDSKWADKNYDKIYNKAYKSSKKEMNKYLKKELDPLYSNKNKGANYINAYNKKLATLMSSSTENVTAPSGRVVKFVAKRGEIGVYMALADSNYDMSKLKNGIWSSGRVAYKKNKVNMSS